MRSYCRENGIKSESELVRQAVVSYIDKDYSDNTLKLSGIKNIKESLSQIHDMLSVFFNYQNMMHLNLLAYHPEIADTLKKAANISAQSRLDKFNEFFRNHLKEEPPFFEALLHKFVTGSLDE
jgi:2-oxo-4-hydroxy-4-carboxy--5-ureidoimidazoline (OHCU) decarboxylase